MSEKIRRAILERVVNPELNKTRDDVNGEITKVYDVPVDRDDISKYNLDLADVNILDSKVGTSRKLEAVPIIHSPANSTIDGRHLRVGDKVVVEFVNGNPLHPQIIGRYYADPFQRKQELEIKIGVNIPDATGYFG